MYRKGGRLQFAAYIRKLVYQGPGPIDVLFWARNGLYILTTYGGSKPVCIRGRSNILRCSDGEGWGLPNDHKELSIRKFSDDTWRFAIANM